MLPKYSVEEWADRVIATPKTDNCCRIVAKLDDERVVKFGCPASFYTGGQNAAEQMMWNTIKDGPASSFFAGVLDGADDGSWIIQEMASGRVHDDDPEVVKRSSSSQKYGIRDMAARQMGVHYLTGELVIRDYGINSVIDDSLSYEKAACGECLYCHLCQIVYAADYDRDEDNDSDRSCNGDGRTGCESCNPCNDCDGCTRCVPHKSKCRCERCYPYTNRNVYAEIMAGQKFFSFINN